MGETRPLEIEWSHNIDGCPHSIYSYGHHDREEFINAVMDHESWDMEDPDDEFRQEVEFDPDVVMHSHWKTIEGDDFTEFHRVEESDPDGLPVTVLELGI